MQALREYSKEKGIPLTKIGAYRYEEGASHFDVTQWNALVTNPSFKEVTCFIPALGGQYKVGLYTLN